MFDDETIRKFADLRSLTDAEQDVTIGLVDRHRALAEEIGGHVEKRYNDLFDRSAIKSSLDYTRRVAGGDALLHSQGDFLAASVAARLTASPKAAGKLGTGKLTDDWKVDYDLTQAGGVTFDEVLKSNFLGPNVDQGKFLEYVRKQVVKTGAFKDVPEKLAEQINQIKALKLPSDVWDELKTFNEFGSMFELPELKGPLAFSKMLSTAWKAGTLSTSPATAIRDGISSYVNYALMGDMNPAAIATHGSKAFAFVRGMPVDPGPGIKEIESYLKERGLPSDSKTRAEAFQNFWNAHYMSGSIVPNVVTADADRMATMDSNVSILANEMGSQKQEFLGGLKRTVTRPWQSFDPRVAGTPTKDEYGRMVERSEGKNPLVNMMNGLRGITDGVSRTTFVLDRVRKTGSLQDAFDMADKIGLNADPRNFTRFENRVMKSVFPFYSFMRQSLPLFMSEFLVNPGGKLGQTVRATRLGQGGSDEYVPYQYMDSAAIPWGKTDDGGIEYLTSFGLMHEDAVKWAGNILQRDSRALKQKVLSDGNPLLKWFVESATNTSLFSQGPMGGRRLDDLDPSMGRILQNIGLTEPDASGRAKPFIGAEAESIAAASPIGRALSTLKVVTADPSHMSAGAKVSRILSGMRFETVTQEMITRDLRDRINAEQIRLGARPLTTVIGADKLIEAAEQSGDLQTVEKLKKFNAALAIQRKLVADQEKKDKKPTTQTLIDRLRALR
jgi:hypothetical protein